jgi:hypothetical protein
MISKRNLGLFIVAVLMLTACQPSQQPITIRPDDAALMQAQNAEQSGDFTAAAQHYLSIANKLERPEKSFYLLKAAAAYYELSQFDQVTQTLANAFSEDLNAEQQFEMAMLQANVALSYADAEQALSYLATIDETQLSASQHQQVLTLKVQSYELLQNWLELANSYIKLERYLSKDEQLANQPKLWRALTQLAPEALDLFNPGMPPATDSGWFALAYAVKAYQANPEAMMVALEDWQRNYPNHPASADLYKESLDAGTHLPSQINSIAVLLPNAGPYKKAAKAIKDGIIAQHYHQNHAHELFFIDIDTNRETGYSDVVSQYHKAVAEGASLVIGPLDKIAVNQMAELSELPVPVLALNRGQSEVKHANFFQFGLAPEDDAIAAANYATELEMQRALVLSPEGNWGDRIADAFTTQWRENGGTVISQASYDASKSDFSNVIKPLLDINDSERRNKALKQTLGPKIEFEPRRRQDIDLLFLVAKPLKARQILPQLKFHRSGKMPVFATSHAYSGQANEQQDIDINGIRLADIPWMLSTSSQDPVYNSLTQGKEHGGLLRLYALGVDAYRLVGDMNQMSRSSDIFLPGATGLLNIDQNRQVNRQPVWATFKNGLIMAIDTTQQRNRQSKDSSPNKSP